MDNKKQKPVYETPFFRDLSGISASGGDVGPEGMCVGGGNLTSEFCTPQGNSPAGGSCEPFGVGPEYGYCTLGDSAVEGCNSGGIHT